MNTDRLNRWLTLLANLGVLAGIILLLVELNQNQEIARAQIRNEIYQGLSESTMVGGDYARVLARADAGEELDPVEVLLLSGFSEQLHRYWENANYQYEMGMYDESEYSAHKNTIRSAMLELFPAALVPHYCRNRDGFSQSYRELIDEFVTAQMCNRYNQRKK